MAHCPHCQALLETPLVCGSCGRLLQTEREPTPFESMGLAISHRVDVADLRRRLLQLGRLVHPDYFATGSEAERERAEHAAALLNEAHEILADEAQRADWIVRHFGGPGEDDERAMPQAFLAEVLEWNESLEDARRRATGSPPDLSPLERDLRARRARALATVADLLSPLPEHGSPALRDVRRELNAVRYMDRTLSEIETLRLARAESRA